MELGFIVVPALAAAAIVVAAALVVRRTGKLARQRKRAEFIQRYTFPAELRNRLQRNHDLSMESSGRVLEGLRQYFLACLSAQRRSIAKEVGMPSKAVDAAWHEFILLTKEYAKFCEQAFGRFLHHTPQAMMQTPTSAAVANTLHQLRGPTLTPAAWATVGTVPLLFALDRELGFEGGHMYDEGTIHELEGVRQAQLAMASSSGGSDSGATSWSGADNAPSDSGGGGGGSCGGSSCGGGGGCGS